MPKSIPDAILDLQLDQAEGSRIDVCDGAPINFADIANVDLAGQAISGSHVKADGDTSGRKNTTPQQDDVAIHTSGNADHVVHSNGVDTIYKITTCSTQALTSGGTVTIPAHKHEVADPS